LSEIEFKYSQAVAEGHGLKIGDAQPIYAVPSVDGQCVGHALAALGFTDVDKEGEPVTASMVLAAARTIESEHGFPMDTLKMILRALDVSYATPSEFYEHV
jgi:hypothetical protein